MAELENPTNPGVQTTATSVPNSKSEGTLTDSEVAFTPDAGSSTTSGGSRHDGDVGDLPTHESHEPHVQPVSASVSAANSPQLLPEHAIAETPTLGPTTPAEEKSPLLTATTGNSSRHASFSGSSSYQEDWDIPPLDRLTMLDLLDNFALPQQLEKLSKGISAQTRKLRKSRDALKSRSVVARERMVEEWRHRVPSAEEQLERYRARMRTSVEKLGRQWNDTRVITMREKVSFICGVLNIFISGYLIGGAPEYMHLWYTAQILYFMPIRFYTYHRRGYHYFLADLCYFVNFLLLLSLWAFPASKRLLVAVYCLAYGNNAVAIVMWRNSLVFHSFDKVTSLFIHVMPCATLHCIVHLLDEELQRTRFPGVYAVKHAAPGSRGAYANIFSMLAWSTVPYAIWQLSYYFFITVRRRDKIAAGRPTSFTWLRRSYSKTWIGRFVLSLPLPLQEPAFMLIQYNYAVLTMLPCPIWFCHRAASSVFLMVVFTWSIYNGATYYIDVFGRRFQKELEALKAEVTKFGPPSSSGSATPATGPVPDDHIDLVPGSSAASPPLAPLTEQKLDRTVESVKTSADSSSSSSSNENDTKNKNTTQNTTKPQADVDSIPLLERQDVTDSNDSNDSNDEEHPAQAKSPGAASAAEAMATGVFWQGGDQGVSQRR